MELVSENSDKKAGDTGGHQLDDLLWSIEPILGQDERGSLIILREGAPPEVRYIGTIPDLPNVGLATAFGLGRDLQAAITAHKMEAARSFLSAKCLTPPAAALRSGKEVWAYSGESRAESLGLLLYLFFKLNRADVAFIRAVAEEHRSEGEADAILEEFSLLTAPLHALAPKLAS